MLIQSRRKCNSKCVLRLILATDTTKIFSNLHSSSDLDFVKVFDADSTTCQILSPRKGGNFLSFHLAEAATSRNVFIITSLESNCDQFKAFVNIEAVFYSSSSGSLFNCGPTTDIVNLADVSKYRCTYNCAGTISTDILVYTSADSDIDICNIVYD